MTEEDRKLAAEYVCKTNLTVHFECGHVAYPKDVINAFIAGRESIRTELAVAKQSLKLSEQSNDDLQKLFEAERARSAKLIDAIRQSIARSDDYGDSHCSRPIRQALAEYEASRD